MQREDSWRKTRCIVLFIRCHWSRLVPLRSWSTAGKLSYHFNFIMSLKCFERQMDAKTFSWRCLDVHSMSFESYGRQMNVRTTLCVYTVLPKQDTILTSIQFLLNVMNVRWTLKQLCVSVSSDAVQKTLSWHSFNVVWTLWTPDVTLCAW